MRIFIHSFHNSNNVFLFFHPFSLEHIFNWDVNEVKSFWLNTWTFFFSSQMMQTQSDTTESKSKCLNILILSENVPILMVALKKIYAEPDNQCKWKEDRKKNATIFRRWKGEFVSMLLLSRTMTHEILILIKINANKCCLNGWWTVSVHLKFDLLGKGVSFNECCPLTEYILISWGKHSTSMNGKWESFFFKFQAECLNSFKHFLESTVSGFHQIN